jgi:hypothetical protein
MSDGIAPHILNSGTRRRWIVSFTPDCPHYPLDRSLGGLQSQSGHCAEEKDLLSLLAIKSWFFVHPACFLLYWHETLCGDWPPPWFRNSKFFQGWVISPTPNPQPGGQGLHFVWPLLLTYLAWVALPGAYASASITLRFTGACRSPFHDKVVVLK